MIENGYDGPDSAERMDPRVHSSSPSGVSRLDEDVILEIFWYLTAEDFKNTQAAGANHVHIPNSFWRRKIGVDFEWMWDFPDANRELNWLRIYNDIMRFSQGNADDIILGIANRRRIWNVCSQLAELYLERERQYSREKLVEDVAKEIIQNSFSTGMALVRAPASKTFTSMTVYFVESLKSLDSEDKTLVAHFNDCGYLSGISLALSSDRKSRRLLGFEADTQRGGKQFKTRIFSFDWITGFELNIEKIDFSQRPNKAAITGIKVLDAHCIKRLIRLIN